VAFKKPEFAQKFLTSDRFEKEALDTSKLTSLLTWFQLEVFICLIYAAIHLAVNILVVIGCETQNKTYLVTSQ
jgi:hypothetical protein